MKEKNNSLLAKTSFNQNPLIFLEGILTLMSLLTSLYLIGYFFFQGYLSGFGLDPEEFSLNFYGYLSQGFYAFLEMGQVSGLLKWLAMIVILFCVAIFVFPFFRDSYKRIRLFRNQSKNMRSFSYKTIQLILGCIAMGSIMVLLSNAAVHLGEKKSDAMKRRWDQNIRVYQETLCGDATAANFMDFIIQYGDKLHEKSGFIVAGSNNLRAIYTSNGVKVYPFSEIVSQAAHRRNKCNTAIPSK